MSAEQLLRAKAIPGVTFEAESVTVSKLARTPARLAFLSIEILLLVAFGAADALPLDALGAALFALAAWVLFAAPIEPHLRRPVGAAVAAAALLGLWILVQSAQVQNNPVANPVWLHLAERSDQLGSSISAGWGDTLAAIVPKLLPFAAFILALELWPTEAEALRLLRLIGIAFAALAAYGLAQWMLSPEKVLFVRRSAFGDSLTATFLNRDSAAALFGCGAILFLVRSTDLLRQLMRRADRNRDVFRFLANAGCAVLLIGALLLTQSKSGIGAAMMGLAFSGGLAASLPISSRSRHRDRASLVRRIGLGVGVAAAIALVLGLLAARTLEHNDVLIDDGYATCQFHGLEHMLVDNWLLGSGAGTFDTISPAYRDPDCGIAETGVSAHSGFLADWITLGLPFVVASVSGALVLAIVLIRGLANRRKMRWVPVVGCGLLTVIVANGAWNYSMQLPGLAALVAALLAPVYVICAGRSQGDEHA